MPPLCHPGLKFIFAQQVKDERRILQWNHSLVRGVHGIIEQLDRDKSELSIYTRDNRRASSVLAGYMPADVQARGLVPVVGEQPVRLVS